MLLKVTNMVILRDMIRRDTLADYFSLDTLAAQTDWFVVAAFLLVVITGVYGLIWMYRREKALAVCLAREIERGESETALTWP